MEQCQGRSKRSLTLCIGYMSFIRAACLRGLITKGLRAAGRELLIMVAYTLKPSQNPSLRSQTLLHHSPHPSLMCNFLRLCFGAQGSRDRGKKEIFAPSGLGGKKQVHSSETDSRLLYLEIGG